MATVTENRCSRPSVSPVLVGVHQLRHLRWLFLCPFFAQVSVSAESEYEIEVGGAYSDNIARVETGAVDELAAIVGLDLTFQHESIGYDVDVVSELEYRDYTKGSFENETVGSANADVALHLIKGRLDWIFEDRFGNLQTDPFQAVTPANREIINYFSTGPNILFRLGLRTAFELDGRFTDNYFEVSDIGNQIASASATLRRGVSPNRSIYLSAQAASVEFDDPGVNTDYDRGAVYFGFNSEISRGTFLLKLGYNEIRSANQEYDGNFAELAWTRDITNSVSFELRFDQRLSDASDEFARFQEPGPGFGDTQQSAGVSEPFQNTRASIRLTSEHNENRIYAMALVNDDEYVESSFLDRSRIEFRLGMVRTLGTSWLVDIEGAFQRTDLLESTRQDDDFTIRAGLSRQLNQSLGLKANILHYDRNSSSAGFSYAENVYALSINYTR